MPAIGILFDIDELDSGLYGHAAYKIFFAAIDTRLLAGCVLSDGDTNATLMGRANQYCIAVNAPDHAAISAVKDALSKSTEKGLLPVSSRFMDDALVMHEPLVQATFIGSHGELVNCTTSWVMAAWKTTQEQRA
ncbi:MAG: hypothetical protein AB1564_10640 [Chloroflexota bacterium]